MENSKIEWADHTFNPWIGCTQVSSACDHCYAQVHQDQHFGRVKWGASQPRSRTSAANWKKPLIWNRQAIAEGTRPFVFCASLADVFDTEVAPAWRHDLLQLIEGTPHLVWLLLTRRIERVEELVERLPKNVALGVSLSNQDEYDRDAPLLREAALKLQPVFTFGNFEPLLGPINLDYFTAPTWVVVGCETGPMARFMPPDWARSLRDQSATMGLYFFFKQASELLGGPSTLLDGKHHRERPDPNNRDWLLGHRDWLDKLLSERGYPGTAPDCANLSMPKVHTQ